MEGFSFDILECTVEMYAEFLDVIDAAFNYKPGWFIKHLGHVLPAPAHVEHEDSTKNLIAVHEGKIIGAVGFYPMDIIASDGTASVSFKLGGVGQVSCMNEYRGRGIMSELLKSGILRMRDSGIEISWLSGLRARYANFGYDLGGCETAFYILARDIHKLERPEEGKDYIATEKDIETLDSIYRSIPARIERDKKLWLRHVRRENISWVIRELDGKFGYICRDVIDDGGVLEVGGDGYCVLSLLARYMREKSKNSVTVKYANCHDTLTDVLYKAANGVTLMPNGQLNVIDQSGVYKKMLPFVKRQCEARKDAEELISKLDSPEPELINAITAKMVGFAYSPLVEGFEFLKPLAFFIPRPDEV